jgi:hypothetical protein
MDYKLIGIVGSPLAIPDQNINTMITILLFLATLVSWWIIFKSIDWFEKI